MHREYSNMPTADSRCLAHSPPPFFHPFFLLEPLVGVPFETPQRISVFLGCTNGGGIVIHNETEPDKIMFTPQQLNGEHESGAGGQAANPLPTPLPDLPESVPKPLSNPSKSSPHMALLLLGMMLKLVFV